MLLVHCVLSLHLLPLVRELMITSKRIVARDGSFKIPRGAKVKLKLCLKWKFNKYPIFLIFSVITSYIFFVKGYYMSASPFAGWNLIWTIAFACFQSFKINIKIHISNKLLLSYYVISNNYKISLIRNYKCGSDRVA